MITNLKTAGTISTGASILSCHSPFRLCVCTCRVIESSAATSRYYQSPLVITIPPSFLPRLSVSDPLTPCPTHQMLYPSIMVIIIISTAVVCNAQVKFEPNNCNKQERQLKTPLYYPAPASPTMYLWKIYSAGASTAFPRTREVTTRPITY